MLIASPRHTEADLRCWAQYEQVDRRHARSARLQRLEARASQLVASFSDAVVSISWGKDSLVVAHLCRAINQPLVWIREEPFTNPDCLIVRDAFLRRFDMPYREIVIQHDPREPERAQELRFERAARAVARDRRRIMGIRADESARRTLSAAVHGEATDRVCRPILRWTSEDVFAYLVKYDLPVPPMYAMLGGGRWDRRWIRTDSLTGEPGRHHGRIEWEMEYYGDVIRRSRPGEAG